MECFIDNGLVFKQKNKMMKEQHNVTYEKYFEIYSILRSDKLKKIEK